MKTIRRIPKDGEIDIAFRRLNGTPWETILARLLVWGLRSHEAHLGTIGEGGLFMVPAQTKTGERIVPAFDAREDWLTRAHGPMPQLKVRANKDLGLRTYCAFRRRDVPFNPYDLRHRWVVLSEEAGIPPAIGAVWAGHTPRTRYAIYTRTLDQRRALAYAHDHGFILNQQPTQSTKSTNVSDAIRYVSRT